MIQVRVNPEQISGNPETYPGYSGRSFRVPQRDRRRQAHLRTGYHISCGAPTGRRILAYVARDGAHGPLRAAQDRPRAGPAPHGGNLDAGPCDDHFAILRQTLAFLQPNLQRTLAIASPVSPTAASSMSG